MKEKSWSCWLFFRGSKYSLKIKSHRFDSRFYPERDNLSSEKRVRKIQQIVEAKDSTPYRTAPRRRTRIQ
ncbi:hypothetical protein DRJ25_02345 [Candidatus Woesearchaeota archaeon]|nr:MAG: hypothetical protein DRJ25_02345 [Candidatus Woesearchaeota archaeon]